MMQSMRAREQELVRAVWEHYREHGRHHLPWRTKVTPYRVLVSEVMLQQTQVDRVVPKYHAFIGAFPSVRDLAAAPLRDVLRLWQGLGYNRRARYLHEAAKCVVLEHAGRFPKTYHALRALPGVGPYTAGAIMAFAYNEPVGLIETNVRAVYLHHCFPRRDAVRDSELMPIIERTLDRERPREWYYALMDYGSHLKRSGENPSRRSKHHTNQSVFAGSDRQLRGAIIRVLSERPCARAEVIQRVARDIGATDVSDLRARCAQQLQALVHDKLLTKRGERYQLPG